MTEEALAEQLLAVAVAALRQQPVERLSLRKIAQQVGVSHQAPYVHFGDKRTFLAAVAGTGLRSAATAAARAVEAAGADPRDRLHALLGAYFEFIESEPHLHDLAYGPLVAKRDHPRLQEAAIAYWNVLHDTVEACQPVGTSEAEVLRRCASAWGTAYGIARLSAMNQIPAAVPAQTEELLHEAVDTLYDGWQRGSSPVHRPGNARTSTTASTTSGP